MARLNQAVVIGAGPNGLSAAVALARRGVAATVLEAQEQIGGGVNSLPLTLPGFVHDLCSAFHPLGIASPFLRSLPLQEHGLEWIHPPVCVAHPLDDGSAVALRPSISDTAENLHDERDNQRYSAVIEPLVAGWRDLLGDALAPPHVPRHPWLLGRFGVRAIRSVEGLARSWFHGDRARALFAGVAAHSVVPFDKLASSALGLMLMLAAHADGWPFPRGGSIRLSEALAGYLLKLGGTIITGRRVSSMADLPPADAYLFDVTPRQLLAIAVDDLPERYRRRLGRFRYGPGVFKVDWALHGPIPWRAAECRGAGVVHIGGKLDEIARSERAAWDGQHCEKPFVLLGQQSLFDATRAPASGRHTGWAYCHVPHGSTFDMTDRIESQVERFAPGFRDLILARATHNCAQMEARNANLIGGDISGGALDLPQLFTRPVASLCPYATPNPRIWLCSSSTPPGAGVHGMCGYHAAQAVLRRVFRVS